ncbi:hypothetical protein ABEB36_009862 [Hypothenemus hampei]|uniref:Uncharacterized protein n=1 Tax=Hypothenemus hampei TaxID=57062 RepID=A0ABD1EI64_HYPHA
MSQRSKRTSHSIENLLQLRPAKNYSERYYSSSRRVPPLGMPDSECSSRRNSNSGSYKVKLSGVVML